MEAEALGITLSETNGSPYGIEVQMATHSTNIKDYFPYNKRTTLYFRLRAVDLLLCSVQHENSQNAFHVRVHVKYKAKGENDIL